MVIGLGCWRATRLPSSAPDSRRSSALPSCSHSWGEDGPTPPSHVVDDRQWSWCYLRKQFKIRNLESLYLQYQQRLHRGYFSVFLLLQMILSIIHASVLLSHESDDPSRLILPDIVAYLVIALFLWPLVAIVFKQRLVKKYRLLPLVVSYLAVAILLCVDIALPIYHTVHSHSDMVLRPAYATHALLACYIFLPLQNNIAPTVLGGVVTVCHLATLGLVTYRHQMAVLRQLLSDAIFLICVNILGLYFRFVNEVVIRRTFLDRRACVESTLKLNYEKEQEEQLMLSILPRHIASRVRDDIRKQLARADHTQPLLSKKPFNELYCERHENVSILYADVVNYTGMTGSLSVNTLVDTLNELFGRFDEASERHQVLRIKFLGDCYYCVAGVPKPNPSHAKACVQLGLDMISIIKEVRDKRKLDIDMRIGVHSGNILSGLLGRCKWQYDIWSRDVIIANHMEQSGRPGMVHVTKQTKKELGVCFVTQPGDGHLRDALLAKYNIETYLISPSDQPFTCEDVRPDSIFDRKASVGGGFEVKQPQVIYKLKKLSNESNARRRTAFMDNNLYMYQQRLKMADVHMAKAIEKLPLGKYDQWFHKEQLHPFCLTFQTEENWELAFLRQPDPLFKFYVLSALVVLVCMLLIQMLGLPSWHWVAWLGFGISASLLLSLLPLTWAHVIWHAIKDPHQELEDIPPPENAFLRLLYVTSLRVVSDACIRTVLYCVVCLLLSICAMADMIDCASEEIYESSAEASSYKYTTGAPDEVECMGPWQMTETCSLALLMSFLFLRIHFQLKLMVGLLILGIYSWCIWCLRPAVFEVGGTWNPELEPRIAHVLNMLFLVVGLHLMDRQAEYMNRLDYRWKRQLSAEKDEASMTRMVNQMLLQNILPKHVAEVYLNTHRNANELYHENYDCVAVMFATLTNYNLCEDGDQMASEISSLQTLNQIICDFDNKLYCKPYRRVEKIKVAGWSYMAACGLDPGRRESNSSMGSEPPILEEDGDIEEACADCTNIEGSCSANLAGSEPELVNLEPLHFSSTTMEGKLSEESFVGSEQMNTGNCDGDMKKQNVCDAFLEKTGPFQKTVIRRKNSRHHHTVCENGSVGNLQCEICAHRTIVENGDCIENVNINNSSVRRDKNAETEPCAARSPSHHDVTNPSYHQATTSNDNATLPEDCPKSSYWSSFCDERRCSKDALGERLAGEGATTDGAIAPPADQFPVILVKFAAEMMRSLRLINKQSKHDFKLRIGIAHGPITAGVVGSQKPLYDVWGNAVNLASRMDSTGEACNIQVPEATAQLLMQQGVKCNYRGQTFVKGKGLMPTYFVALTEEFQLSSEGERNPRSR